MNILFKSSAALLLYVISSVFLFAQSDSLDTSEKQKERIPVDSLTIPMMEHGSINLLAKTKEIINKRDIQLYHYNSLNDLLNYKLNTFSMHTGEFFNFNTFSMYGAKPRANSFAFNTRELNDHVIGIYNHSTFPTEFFENIEIFKGSEAAIFADNASGSFTNIQEIRYNTAKPYTRIYFGQDDYESIIADGIFSKNFAPNWNFTFGFRSIVYDGRYEAASTELWNVRSILRYNPDSLTSYSITYLFSDHSNRLNGGIDTNNSFDSFGNLDIYNELNAGVNYDDFNLRNFSHDVNFAHTKINLDSTFAYSTNLFFTAYKRRYFSGDDFLLKQDSTNLIESNDIVAGGNINIEKKFFDFIKLKGGANFNYVNLDITPLSEDFEGLNLSGFALSEIDLSAIEFSGGLRYIRRYGNNGISFGGRANTLISDKYDFFFDYSFSNRLPTLSEGTFLDNEKHNLFLMGISYRSDYFFASLEGFYRIIADEIGVLAIRDTNGIIIGNNFFNSETATYAGVNLNLKGKFLGHFFYNIFGQINPLVESSNFDSPFPLAHGRIRTYYEYLVGRSLLHAGVEVYGFTTFNGMQFSPISWSYLNYEQQQSDGFNGIDLFLSLRLGNAFVRLRFRNLLNFEYYNMPLYPMQDRNLALSVAWAFDD